MTPQPKEQSHSALAKDARIRIWPTHWAGGSDSVRFAGRNVPWVEQEHGRMICVLIDANEGTMGWAKELEQRFNSHARLLAQNEMLRKALEQINGCYVGKFGGEVIGLKSNTALDEPCRIARAALEQMEKV